MAFEFILPDIGEGVVEAEIQRWFVKPGDEVEEDQPLVEVMTDKATVTIPSPRRGRVLRLHHGEGEIAKVHEPLLELDTDETVAARPAPERAATPGGTLREPAPGAAAAPVPAARAAVPVPRQAAPGHRPTSGSQRPAHPSTPQQKALATPAVRAMARQLGVDLNAVRGTGPGGRVTREDLHQACLDEGVADGGRRTDERHLDRSARNGQAAQAEPAPAPQRPAPFADELPEQPATDAVAHGDEVVPFRGIRRRIAERMAQSKRTAAHFTFAEEVDVSELVAVKNRIAAAARDDGVKVTFLPFIVKAVVASLKKHPWLNATLDEARGEIRIRREYHIGIASATEQGLVVPVLRHADRLSLVAMAREIERLSSESKAGRSRPSDMGGSTFTITSLGAMGGLFATPIINFPEVAILGVHRIRATPVVRDGQIVARDMMNLSLSFDHRVVDGHVGARFTYSVIRYLEDPNLLFMDMV